MVKVLLTTVIVLAFWVWTGGYHPGVNFLQEQNITFLRWLAVEMPGYFIGWRGSAHHMVLLTIELFLAVWLILSVWGWIRSAVAKPAKPTVPQGRNTSPLSPQPRRVPDGHGGYTPGLGSGANSRH